MRTFFLLLNLAFISNSISAQQHEWAPIGAEWHYTHVYHQPPPPYPAILPHFDYNKITCIGDTVVGGKYCKHLSFDKPNCNLWHTYHPVLTHQDSGKIYHWNVVDSSFTLYIDFNANQGDMWKMPLWEHNFLSIPYYDTAYVQVDSVSYLYIANDSLKQLHVTYLVYDTLGQPLYVNGLGTNDVITERLGPSSAMFPVEHGYCDEEYDKGLRCYSDSSIGFHSFVPYSCDTFWYITFNTKETVLTEQHFQVFPNPTKDYITIHSKSYNNDNESHYYIYNTTGKLINSGEIKGIYHKLYLGDLHQGVYFIKIRTKEEEYSTKLIKP